MHGKGGWEAWAFIYNQGLSSPPPAPYPSLWIKGRIPSKLKKTMVNVCIAEIHTGAMGGFKVDWAL